MTQAARCQPADSLPVHWWPARLPAASRGVFVIGIEGDGDRVAARRRIRAALREALAQLAGLPPEDILIQSTPGSAPFVEVRAGSNALPASAWARVPTLPGIAISHDGPLSLAAIHLDGPAGIDLMQVEDGDDWRTVARDYLGPDVTAALDAAPHGERALAFARAWTEREARLKCLGLQLTEWSAGAAQREAGCRCVALVLPAGFAGTLALA